MSKKKIYIIVIAVFLILTGIIGFGFYQKIFFNNVLKNGELFIKTQDNMADLNKKITPFLNNINSFIWLSSQKNFTKPKGGRYVLKKKMSNNDLVNMLRSGNQTAEELSFNNQDTLEKLAGRLAQQIETDSISLLNSFTDEEFLSKNNLTKKSVLQIFIPNSYQFYWNVSPEKFRDKMLMEYKRFWTNKRLEKAKKIHLSKEEVITLASIVQKETAKNSERPIIAGLYLNRLKKGWPLQADPTIIYCIKDLKGQNYLVKRVLRADLKINSPYNTYKNKGLPPTLISMPDISAIDAVLNYEKHDYFYMCASVKRIGYHEFSKTLAQHNRNAKKYQQWINKQGINR